MTGLTRFDCKFISEILWKRMQSPHWILLFVFLSAVNNCTVILPLMMKFPRIIYPFCPNRIADLNKNYLSHFVTSFFSIIFAKLIIRKWLRHKGLRWVLFILGKAWKKVEKSSNPPNNQNKHLNSLKFFGNNFG